MELAPKHTFVVYDTRTGDVIQIHHFSAMPGAIVPPKARLEEIALQQAARKHKRELSTMAVLESSPQALQPKTTYRVDLAERQLRANSTPK